jgi:hypothetical protein
MLFRLTIYMMLKLYLTKVMLLSLATLAESQKKLKPPLTKYKVVPDLYALQAITAFPCFQVFHYR